MTASHPQYFIVIDSISPHSNSQLLTAIHCDEPNTGFEPRLISAHFFCPLVWLAVTDEEQENGETKPLSEEEYSELLKEKGKQNLVPTKTKSESQIAVQFTQFQYGVDYFVGDFVTVEHHRFGIRQNKIQLVGMIESFDHNGRNLTPTFKEE